MQKQTLCPCESGQALSDCCLPLIENRAAATTAEQLMRSRYTAYVLKNERYLLQSWHPDTRPQHLDLKNDTTQWRKLYIIESDKNHVSFVAMFDSGRAGDKQHYALSEKSEFIYEPEIQYLKGENVQTMTLTKNMPCPCQSGKKFKRCCEKYFV